MNRYNDPYLQKKKIQSVRITLLLRYRQQTKRYAYFFLLIDIHKRKKRVEGKTTIAIYY